MTPDEAFENQLIIMLGNQCLTIAKQAGAAAALQNQLADEKAISDTLKKGK